MNSRRPTALAGLRRPACADDRRLPAWTRAVPRRAEMLLDTMPAAVRTAVRAAAAAIDAYTVARRAGGCPR